jgi:hypothetical protein
MKVIKPQKTAQSRTRDSVIVIDGVSIKLMRPLGHGKVPVATLRRAVNTVASMREKAGM